MKTTYLVWIAVFLLLSSRVASRCLHFAVHGGSVRLYGLDYLSRWFRTARFSWLAGRFDTDGSLRSRCRSRQRSIRQNKTMGILYLRTALLAAVAYAIFTIRDNKKRATT